MLVKGYDYDSIIHTLKVSRTTVGHVSLWLKEKGRGFRQVLAKIQRNESLKNILTEIQDAFEDLLASAPGQNWSNSKKLLWQRRREREKPY